MTSDDIWMGVGFAGTALFSLRFFVQWISSEKAGRSVMPVAFWYFSVAGGALVLAYAVYRLDPVFIVSQAGGFLVYSRNLYLIHYKENRRAAPAKESGADGADAP